MSKNTMDMIIILTPCDFSWNHGNAKADLAQVVVASHVENREANQGNRFILTPTVSKAICKRTF